MFVPKQKVRFQTLLLGRSLAGTAFQILHAFVTAKSKCGNTMLFTAVFLSFRSADMDAAVMLITLAGALVCLLITETSIVFLSKTDPIP